LFGLETLAEQARVFFFCYNLSVNPLKNFDFLKLLYFSADLIKNDIMTENKFNIRWVILVIMIVAAASFRLLPQLFGLNHFFNFSPIGGMALFGAAYFTRKWNAFIVPFLALWVSNLILDNVIYAQYYNGFAWFANWEVYLAFAAIVGVGFVVLKKITTFRLIGASLSASVLFYLITNFFVWATGTMYAKSLAGLIACYIAAIPFFWNTLAGDLFFVALLFGTFELAKKHAPMQLHRVNP
jgi:hypothetical protein